MDLEQHVFQEERSTDVHWRAKEGRANFHHRWNFLVQLPAIDLRIVIQVRIDLLLELALHRVDQAWDKDILASNDLIGEGVIPLKELMLLGYSQGKKLMRARYTDIDLSKTVNPEERSNSKAYLRMRQRVYEMLDQILSKKESGGRKKGCDVEEGWFGWGEECTVGLTTMFTLVGSRGVGVPLTTATADGQCARGHPLHDLQESRWGGGYGGMLTISFFGGPEARHPLSQSQNEG
eukprot:762708-Hanusia_phi.AAC.8